MFQIQLAAIIITTIVIVVGFHFLCKKFQKLFVPRKQSQNTHIGTIAANNINMTDNGLVYIAIMTSP